MTKGYDEKCLELAGHFVDDYWKQSDVTPARAWAVKSELAQIIQDAVELYLDTLPADESAQ